MVGKLARYLRMAGYDVAYFNDAPDDMILKIAREEDRIVLTRDTLMLKRRDFKNGALRAVFIKDDKLKEQLMQVRSELKIKLEPDLSRCLVCNDLLTKAEKKSIADKVPPYVYRTQENYMYCSKCDRYYWRGTHYSHIKNFFDKLNNS
ncbi:hypothetical protein ES705_35358 [subsurface metagenome]